MLNEQEVGLTFFAEEEYSGSGLYSWDLLPELVEIVVVVQYYGVRFHPPLNK